MEEVRDGEIAAHMLDVPAGTAAYIDPDRLASELTSLGLILQLRGDQAEHILAAMKKLAPGRIVDASLGLVEALEGILLATGAVASVRLQATVPDEAQRSPGRVAEFLRGLKFGEVEGEVGEQENDEQNGGQTDLIEGVGERDERVGGVHTRDELWNDGQGIR